MILNIPGVLVTREPLPGFFNDVACIMKAIRSRPDSGYPTGSVTPVILLALAIFGVVVGMVYLLTNTGSGNSNIEPILATVEKGEFVSQVLDQGEIQSSENVEIRCEVRARNGTISVIKVVPEGTRVRGGDFLVQLDSNSLELELETQKILVVNAETAVIQADAELMTAVETLKEYEQGLFVEKKKLIENDIYNSQSLIETAKQELTLAKAVLEHSKKLQGKGFITSQALEVAGFEVKRAEFALKSAKNQLELAQKQEEVLVNITRVKETVQLKSNIEAAKVTLANQRESLIVEKNKLAEIKNQIAKCEIRVPEGVQGQVVYAKESSRGGNDWVLEEGTSVREYQVLIRLPNPDKMEVKALINEQSITQIRPGMPAKINVDALNDQTLTGVVTKVNQYAESSGWMSSSVRKYAVLVVIDNPPDSLKPGMNSSVAIQVRLEPEAIKAPIQCVYAVQDRQFCLIKTGSEAKPWETREIKVDGDNSKFVLVESGLEPGQQLVMNPGAYKDLMELPEVLPDRSIAISDSMKSRIESLKTDQTTSIGQVSNPESSEVAQAEKPESGGERPGAGRPRRGGGGGPGGGGPGEFSMPASAAALIKDKDKNGDGKLTKDEIGSPFSFFFDRIDTDGDSFVSETEADKSIQQMKQRMQNRGSGGPPGGSPAL